MPIMMALGWMAFGDLWSGSMRRQQPNSIIIPYEERHFSLSLCVCVLCCVELCDGGSVDIIILVYSSAKFFLSFFFSLVASHYSDIGWVPNNAASEQSQILTHIFHLHALFQQINSDVCGLFALNYAVHASN